MPQKNYNERVRKLAAYCAAQYNLLEIYDPHSNTRTMLKEISRPVIKAMRKKRERNLKSLEKLSEKIDEKILNLQKQKSDILTLDLNKFEKVMQILSVMKREYNN